MRSCYLEIEDEHHTSYGIDIEYELLERDEDTGIMSEGADVQVIKCQSAYIWLCGERKNVLINDQMKINATKWVETKFEDEIQTCADDHAADHANDDVENDIREI